MLDTDKALDYVDSCQEICHPIFESGIINYFTYIKSTVDGKMLFLSSNKTFQMNYFENKYYEISAFRDHPSTYNQDYILCSALDGPSQKITCEAAEKFNIHNIFVFVNQQADYCEFFQYASPEKGTKSISYILNNQSLFKKFNFYFKDQGREFLERLDVHGCSFPPKQVNEEFNDRANSGPLENNIYDQTKKFYLGIEYGKKYLTQREVECIRLYAKGWTANDIAEFLFISKRTVDRHLENLKMKLGCHKLSRAVVECIRIGLVDI